MHLKGIVLLEILIIAITKITYTNAAHQTFDHSIARAILNGSSIDILAAAYQPPKSINKIRLIQDEVKSLKHQMERLKASVNLKDEDKSLIVNLESIIETTRNMLDNQDRELKQMMTNVETSIQDLLQEIIKLTKAQEQTHKQLLEQQDENKRRSMLTDVIVDIKSNDFQGALDKMNHINNDQKNQFIIKEIYRNQEGNFDLIVRFAKSIKDSAKSFSILKALHHEMQTNGHQNIEKLMTLVDVIRMKTATSYALKIEGESIVKDVQNVVESEAIYLIRKDMLSGSNKSSQVIDKLTYKLDLLNEQQYYRIILNVVKDIYRKMTVPQMLLYFNSQTNSVQKRIGMNAIYQAIKDRNDLNKQAIVSFALGLKEAMSHGSNTDFETLRQKLPECIRNVVFAKSVCLKSVFLNEYFYAAAGLNYDNERRRVFTWIPGGKDNIKPEFWSFEASDDNFYIKNVGFNEYLYAAGNQFNLDTERRRVFTWIPGGHSEKGSEYWQVEPNGENCYIKSLTFDEYLYPIRGMDYDRDRRRLATWIPKGCDSACLWKVEECG